jgi:hypothetical protein
MRPEKASVDGSKHTLQRSPGPQLFLSEEATEHVRCRNYDHDCGYDIQIVIRRVNSTAFDRRLHLRPGGVRSLSDVVPTGTWQVAVSLDGAQPRTGICAIGQSIDQTAVVECGNGAIAVSDRVRSSNDGHGE